MAAWGLEPPLITRETTCNSGLQMVQKAQGLIVHQIFRKPRLNMAVTSNPTTLFCSHKQMDRSDQ